MSRRARALLFFGLAAAAALTGAGMVDSYRERTLADLGDLRPVAVTARPLSAAKTITPRIAARNIRVVRIPGRFAPAGAVAEPRGLIGLRPLGDLPAGTFLTEALMRPPAPGRRPSAGGLGRGRRPVELRVGGAAALETGRRPRLVDVVVIAEPTTGLAARTFVAAAKVPLLSLMPAAEGSEPGSARAVLALRRAQALRLIRAESFARGIRLLPRPEDG